MKKHGVPFVVSVFKEEDLSLLIASKIFKPPPPPMWPHSIPFPFEKTIFKRFSFAIN